MKCYLFEAIVNSRIFQQELERVVEEERKNRSAEWARRLSVCANGFNAHFIEVQRNTTSIGNLHCVYNARSAWLRCAVNPHGPCESCPHLVA